MKGWLADCLISCYVAELFDFIKVVPRQYNCCNKIQIVVVKFFILLIQHNFRQLQDWNITIATSPYYIAKLQPSRLCNTQYHCPHPCSMHIFSACCSNLSRQQITLIPILKLQHTYGSFRKHLHVHTIWLKYACPAVMSVCMHVCVYICMCACVCVYVLPWDHK